MAQWPLPTYGEPGADIRTDTILWSVMVPVISFIFQL
jgi:hypothetical protein